MVINLDLGKIWKICDPFVPYCELHASKFLLENIECSSFKIILLAII